MLSYPERFIIELICGGLVVYVLLMSSVFIDKSEFHKSVEFCFSVNRDNVHITLKL